MSERIPGGVVHKMPTDLRTALLANDTALTAWKDITPLARNEFICWVEDAKQEKTRERRIAGPRKNSRKVSAGPAASTGNGRVRPDAAVAPAVLLRKALSPVVLHAPRVLPPGLRRRRVP